jgi:hypothetical protein
VGSCNAAYKRGMVIRERDDDKDYSCGGAHKKWIVILKKKGSDGKDNDSI